MNIETARKIAGQFKTVGEFREAARFMTNACRILEECFGFGEEDNGKALPPVEDMASWRINDAGREYIRQWLLENVKIHKKHGWLSDEQLLAYEMEALDSMGNGNRLELEVLSFFTVSGHTGLCRIDDEFLEC